MCAADFPECTAFYQIIHTDEVKLSTDTSNGTDLKCILFKYSQLKSKIEF